ncbi:MAG: hypothetical protein ACM3SM_14440 [Bacteroidota bacterium]
MNLAIVDPAESRHISKTCSGYDIEQLIRTAAGSGIRKVFYAVDTYRKDIINYLGDKEFCIPVSMIPVITNTRSDGVSAVIPLLGEESVCFIASDLIPCNNVISEFIKFSEIAENADGIISVVRSGDYINPLCIALNEDNTIIKFSELKDGYGWAAGGLYFFGADVIPEICELLQKMNYDIRIVLNDIIKQGFRLVGFALPVSDKKREN